jgi:hypothetical protein
MLKISEQTPKAATGNPKLATDITDKRGFAARWGFSTRHIDNLLSQGCPHLKIGKRRVRIVIPEADAWMIEQFGTRLRRRATETPSKGDHTARR